MKNKKIPWMRMLKITALLIPAVLLILQVMAGVIVYGGLSLLFRVESMQLMLQVAKRLIKKA